MAFASIHIPGFLIQAVVRAEPALRKRAVALVEGVAPLWNVVAASQSALQAGIQLGMTKSQAEQFRSIEIRHRSSTQEKSAHAALMDLGWSVSPRVEDTAPDTIVLDLDGLGSLFGSAENIASELTHRASSLGLIANVTVASNIEAAILAARGFPGITVIPPDEESRRLGVLPVQTLSAPAEILDILERWGIRTCEALAALPLLELSERLGQEGVRLHALARGASLRSLTLAEPALSFEEEMALEDSVAELEPLAFLLGRLLDQLCARLHARSLAVHSIRTRFDLDTSSKDDFERVNGNSRRTRGSAREKSAASAESKIYEKVLTLPVPVRDSKMLLKLLRLQLQSDPPRSPILKVALTADPAPPRAIQGGLFLPSSPDPEKLELTIARLASVVGDANIGSPEVVDTHRPGEFRMSRFSPLPVDSKGLGNRTKTTARSRAGKPAATFRIFRPPLLARVELREGRPVRVFFRGMNSDVVTASGPWRSSGDWWREDAWQHDEWDLEIQLRSSSSSAPSEPICNPHSRQEQKQAVYRVYYDSMRQSWFVRGVYD
jgi:protein ImuB